MEGTVTRRHKAMEYRRLGSSDLMVSRICLGALSFGDPARRPWTLTEADSRPLVRAALDDGINFFDTANAYMSGESERILGAALADYARRSDVVIATKVGWPVGPGPQDRGLSRAHIFREIDDSLRRLRTDYIDLYQIHRWDPLTPIEETIGTLDELVREGKVRYLGASSMAAWQFAKAQCLARHCRRSPFVSMQAQYNLAYREEEREMIPFCLSEGIGFVPWSPLARGFLSGTRSRENGPATTRGHTDDLEHSRYHRDVDFAILDRVNAIARRLGASPAQVALAWLLGKPVVTAPIVGVTRMHHLKEAVAALSVSLDADQVAALEAPYQPREINDHE
jgi:aryl-alcohol dehydrogenase (NADP+)